MPDRIPSLLEQSIKTNAAGLADEVRTQLGCAGSSDVASALVPLQSDVQAISGVNINQASQITAISGSTLSLQLSASAAFVDIESLDLSITQAIVTLFDTSGASALSAGSVTIPGSAMGYITVNCNGTPVKLIYFI